MFGIPIPDNWLTLILGAIGLYLLRYFTNEKLKVLSEKVVKLEIAEHECQEVRKHQEVKLAAAYEMNQLLREVVPTKLVDGVEALLEQTNIQTEELRKQTGSLAKFDKWDSDPTRICKLDAEYIRTKWGIKITEDEVDLIIQERLRRQIAKEAKEKEKKEKEDRAAKETDEMPVRSDRKPTEENNGV